jgi:hypothetical protein
MWMSVHRARQGGGRKTVVEASFFLTGSRTRVVCHEDELGCAEVLHRGAPA